MLRYVCDVEGCDTTTDVVEKAMFGNTPAGWHRVVTARELENDEIRKLPAPARVMARKRSLMKTNSRLMCPKHPMPAFKEGASNEGDEDVLDSLMDGLDPGMGGLGGL